MTDCEIGLERTGFQFLEDVGRDGEIFANEVCKLIDRRREYAFSLGASIFRGT